MPATVKIIQPGTIGKPNPFTVCIVANPALESPWSGGTFISDAMPTQPAIFDTAVQFILDCLYGRLPRQAEKVFDDPAIGPNIRIVSVLETGLPATDGNALAAEDGTSNLLIPRRTKFAPFLAARGIGVVDIAYVVSASLEHDRASAYPATDDDTDAGVAFTFDGIAFSHRHFSLIPGTIALHATSRSLTPLHEFGHALSSYTNGRIADLYVDSSPAVNCKSGRPIPLNFANYNGRIYSADPTRDGLGYGPGWSSYHCELIQPALPAVMDNYFQSSTVPEECQHDAITRQFLRDRLIAKIGR